MLISGVLLPFIELLGECFLIFLFLQDEGSHMSSYDISAVGVASTSEINKEFKK